MTEAGTGVSAAGAKDTRTAVSLWSWERAVGWIPPQRLQGQLCTLILASTPRTARQWMPAVLSLAVCSTSLQEPQETHSEAVGFFSPWGWHTTPQTRLFSIWWKEKKVILKQENEWESMSGLESFHLIIDSNKIERRYHNVWVRDGL